MRNYLLRFTFVFLWAVLSLSQAPVVLPEDSEKPIHTIHIVPQSHIDVVWLWRYDPETIHRCCKMTFTQALDNMDKFPEYTFSQSQVPLYEPLEKLYPDLYRRIKEYVRAGRWEIAGGMYVEPEGGEPNGELLVRQCVMGKRWFQKNFNVDVTTGWQPDAWGHPAQLPQIFAKTGITSYLWRRGSAGGPRNDVSEKMFWWEAPDGSKVLAWRFVDPEKPPYPEWKKDVQFSKEKYKVNDTLIVIGWGDHGGGPTAKDIQTTQEFSRSLPSDTKVKFSSFSGYADAVLEQKPQLPTIKGDLGFELQADLTNVGEIKKGNRDGENLLLSTEKWASIATQWFSARYPQEELEEAWKKLLFNQFHDILGGSLIPEAIGDAMQNYQSVRDSGNFITGDSLKSIAKSINTEGEGQPVLVFNPLAWKRTDIVEIAVEFSQKPENLILKDAQGKVFPCQIVECSSKKEKFLVRGIFIAEDVPSLGYKTFFAVESKDSARPSSALQIAENRLENEYFLAVINPLTGCIQRLFDKRNEKEMLQETGEGNDLVAIEDEGDSEGRFISNSDVFGKAPGRAESIHAVSAVRVIENGPVRAKIRIEKKYQNSFLTQDIIFYSKIDRVDFDLSLDWHDIHRMIKVAFPFALKNPLATYDAPYTTVERPADGMEYPAQKWVDLQADGYGIALINNSRYAHDVQGNTIRMSVLRSPTHPALNTDEGKHTVGYSLYPHQNSWKQSAVVQKGYDFNHPLIPLVTASHPGEYPKEKSFISVQPENVVLEVVKKAYNSEQMILRLCEMHGQSCKAAVTFAAPVQSAQETDMLENEVSRMESGKETLEFPMKSGEIKTIKVSLKK